MITCVAVFTAREPGNIKGEFVLTARELGLLSVKMRFIPPQKRYVPGQMNKLEQRYQMYLDTLKKAGHVVDYVFEGMKLRLADKTTYTPDFIVVKNDLVEVHECKGYWHDDARVKIKVAADKYWWMKFVGVKWVKGNWEYEEF